MSIDRHGPPADLAHFTVSEVTQPFEGQGQVDSNEIKVTGSRCPWTQGESPHVESYGWRSSSVSPYLLQTLGSEQLLAGDATRSQPFVPMDSHSPPPPLVCRGVR